MKVGVEKLKSVVDQIPEWREVLDERQRLFVERRILGDSFDKIAVDTGYSRGTVVSSVCGDKNGRGGAYMRLVAYKTRKKKERLYA